MILTKQNLDKIFSEQLSNQQNCQSKISKNYFGDFVKYTIFAFLGKKIKWKEPKNKILGKDIKNVLILRYDAIGDYVVSTSAIRWLKAAIPNVVIDVISSERNHLLIESDPLVNSSFPIPYSKGLGISTFPLRKHFKKKNYDLILSLVFSNSTKGAIISRITAPNAENISVYHSKRAHIYGLVFNRQIRIPNNAISWADKMLKFVVDNIEPIDEVDDINQNPYIYISKESMQCVQQIIQDKGLAYSLNTENIFFLDGAEAIYKEKQGRRYCLINIAGAEVNRILTAEKTILYVKFLFQLFPNIHIYISGAPSNTAVISQIVNSINSDNCSRVELNLLGFIALLSGSWFVVSPDTAVVHIAAAAKRPLLVLYTDIGKGLSWFPHKTEYVSVVSPDSKSINLIPEHELEEATMLLKAILESTNE